MDSFYRIKQIEKISHQHYRFSVTLVEHLVYEGHFPGNPVMPGVCSLQMVAECAGKTLGYPVYINYIHIVKFLGIIRPSFDNELEIDLIFDDEMLLKATIKSSERMVMSCKMNLKKMNNR